MASEGNAPLANFSESSVQDLPAGQIPKSLSDEFQLLDGEENLLVLKGVTYVDVFSSTPLHATGSLTLTNHRLLFRDHSSGIPGPFVSVYHGVISRIDKIANTSSQTLATGPGSIKSEKSILVEIFCKDLRNVKFIIGPESHSKTKKFIEKLNQYAFAPLANDSSNPAKIFAFVYNETFENNGWDVYNAEQEFKRMGIPNDSWKLLANRHFELCDTYPALVLSWIHPESQAVICRSSQPTVGVTNSRSEDDENYLRQIMDLNVNSPKLFIADARPHINAVANKAKGGGSELESNYQSCRCELVFLDIPNIHVMRQSLQKVKSICFPVIDESKWLSNIDQTKYLDHIKCILRGAIKVADRVETYKTSVLVHCSDGWDRTAQLTALAMLMLDPYYRTIEGFQVLVEKEWVSLGHMFAHRIGHGENKKSDSEQSPVFLQFLDCVWQISEQFANAFEFNEHFLLTIAEHLYSCQFGTFLGNCEKEIIDRELRTTTISLWSMINSDLDVFRNPLYLYPESHQHVLFPTASIRRLKLWKRYYCQWNPKFLPQEPIHARNLELLKVKEKLQQRLKDLEHELHIRREKGLTSPQRLEAVV